MHVLHDEQKKSYVCIGSRSNLVIEYEANFRWHLCTSYESLCPTWSCLSRPEAFYGIEWNTLNGESRWKPETSVCVTKQAGAVTACWWLFKVFDKGFIPVQVRIKRIFPETFYKCIYMHLYVGIEMKRNNFYWCFLLRSNVGSDATCQKLTKARRPLTVDTF